MKKTILSLAAFVVFAFSAAAQYLSCEITSPTNGATFGKKGIDVDVHCVSSNPDQAYPIYFQLFINGVPNGNGTIFVADTVIVMPIAGNFPRGTYVFQAEIFDGFEDVFSNVVTTIKVK